ncbi:MAG: radical SAM protein [Rhodospirillales bacterium]|nr:hypothetical protein [Rhodospirillaceae bacterium]MDP6427712.1 radical SAM protein [Rhodospirillales bacterium]MDP6643355.1 radical SAM protein [Rhodospirillales bacterium]MDP6840603.1 radical SAM protein [Rhodospirillales bacterium]
MGFHSRPYATSVEADEMLAALNDRYDSSKGQFLGKITQRPWTNPALRISVTNRCNLSCTYCYDRIYQPPLRAKSDMDAEQVRNIFARYPNPSYVFVLGGEPFLNPDAVIEILDACPSRMTISSNGQLFNPDVEAVLAAIAKRLRSGRQTLLQISSEEGGKSTERGTTDNEGLLLKFAGALDGRIKIKFTMTETDVPEIENIASWYWRRSLPVQFDFADGGHGDGRDQDISEDNAKRVHEFTRRALDAAFDEWVPADGADSWPLRRIKTLLNVIFPRAIMQVMKGFPVHSACGILGHSIYFGPSGEAAPCHRWRQHQYKHPGDSENLTEEIRQFHSDVGADAMAACETCQWRASCGGVCPAVMNIYGPGAIAGRCKFQGALTDATFGFIMDRKYEDDPRHAAFLDHVISQSSFEALLDSDRIRAAS